MTAAVAFSLGAQRTLRVVMRERVRRGAPRLRRALPQGAMAGDNLFLEGDNLGGADLRVEFGAASTWAVPIDDRTAFCIVPQSAAGPVCVSRFGLRSNPVPFGGGEGDDPTRVIRVDPADRLRGVFRDTPVLVRLSRPADAASLGPETFHVDDLGGRVPGRARLSPDGYVVIWSGERLLDCAVEHVVVISGLRDGRGHDVTPHQSRFVPCTLARADLCD